MEQRTHLRFNNRKITNNSFMNAFDTDGKPVFYTDANGCSSPVMIGVTEFGVPGVPEFIRGEAKMKSHKVPAYFIIWIPNGNGMGHGVSINGEMYREMQNDPDKYPERIQALKEFNFPTNICLD